MRPDERLGLPSMVALGSQHVLAMFGGTALVPVLTGFPVTTTIFFSGVGTVIFLLVTGNRVPSYTGSSFAFIAPVISAQTQVGMSAALGGIVCAGIALVITGLIVDRVGARLVEFLFPPVVTGVVVMIVGLNLAPVAKQQFTSEADVGLVTLLAILLTGVALRGFLPRMSILLGMTIGYAYAAVKGGVDWAAVDEADWIGLPEFSYPSFDGRAIALIVPAVLFVLVAENVGHVKAVAAMTDSNLDNVMGRALAGDGLATAMSGLFGGSGTTTYAENIGVMGLTRVYSTLACLIAGFTAMLLGLLPKFGAVVSSTPAGVLGGAATALFGMIAVLGARIWIEGRVNFRDQVNLSTAAVALTVGVGDFTLVWGDYEFAGIAMGSLTAIVIFHLLRAVKRANRASAGQNTTPNSTDR